MEKQENSRLYKIRHSLAHVLAQAVKAEFPKAKLGFGPPTDTGFFYDFDFGEMKFSDEMLKPIESRMKKIIGQRQKFEMTEGNFPSALAKTESIDEPYKIENVKNLHERGVQNFSFFQNGTFIDLCEGPHVEHTGELPVDAFKLDRVAGAFWLGNEKNKMLTRIYALAFETREQLTDFLNRRKIAEEFDHKKLGKELEIFHFESIVGKGLPLWLPNGTVIRDEIEKYAKEVEFRNGYKRVSTPHITHADLFHRSQHLPAYEESMFPPMICKHEDTGFEEKYYLKPMNCPFHHLIFDSRMRSYRELPLRLAEYGTVYRFEQSGELAGLLRVRCMTMNDAHVYLAEDQLESEIKSIVKMYNEFYETFKLKDYTFRWSIRGEENKHKFKGDDAMWSRAEAVLEKVLIELKVPYYPGVGEAAFYGPKLDIQFKNLMGREETVSTIQVDFLSPANFNLKYVDSDGTDKVPVIIHRAPLSTHERFISFIMEYYGGAFPTWCAPLQVSLIPVNESCMPYCQEIADDLTAQYIRVEIDSSSASFSKKIRTNTVKKIPIVLVIGNNEVDQNTVTVRRYGFTDQETLSLNAFKESLREEIRLRKNFREPMGSII
jgi:threonyl-tRNA synthetase